MWRWGRGGRWVRTGAGGHLHEEGEKADSCPIIFAQRRRKRSSQLSFSGDLQTLKGRSTRGAKDDNELQRGGGQEATTGDQSRSLPFRPKLPHVVVNSSNPILISDNTLQSQVHPIRPSLTCNVQTFLLFKAKLSRGICKQWQLWQSTSSYRLKRRPDLPWRRQ